MIDRKFDYNVRTLHKTFNEIGSQFDEVHHNLSYNIEKCKKKKEKINSYSTHKINTCLQMIKRERQLTMYANSLILKQKSINSKKKQFSKKTDSEIQVLDEEIEKANIQLQSIYKEQKRLIQKRQELQIIHQNLSSTIQKSTFALDEIKQNENESLFNQNHFLSSITEDNCKIQQKIEKRHNKIEQVNDSTIEANKSIIRLKIAIQNAQISNQSMNAKILCAQARLNKIQNGINEFRSDFQSKQSSIFDKTEYLKEEENKLNNLKNNAQVHCEKIRQEINSIKIFANETEKAINDKTVEISLKNDKINEINVEIINLKEEKENVLDQSIIKTNQLKKSTDKIIELNNCIQSICQEKDETKDQLKKENLSLQEIKKVFEDSIPLVEECIQFYNKIDVAFQAEDALVQLIKESDDKNKLGLPNIKKNPKVKEEKVRALNIIKSLNNEFEIEKANLIEMVKIIQNQQKYNLNCQKMKIEIENKIKQTKIFNDPVLLSIKSDPNIENVTTLIKSLKMKREQRMDRKKRDNDILQKRFEELTKRINIRKRKMKRQINSIEKEKDDFDILPDEEKIIYRSIESLHGLAKEQLLLWNKSDESELLLNSWEKQIEDLYNKLDEFVIRK